MSGGTLWGPVSGLLLCPTWAPMAVAIPHFPILARRTPWRHSGARIRR